MRLSACLYADEAQGHGHTQLSEFRRSPLLIVFTAAGVRESVLTYFTLVPIAGGVVIASGGEPLFNLLGFMACIIATCCRALKSVVQVRALMSLARCPYSMHSTGSWSRLCWCKLQGKSDMDISNGPVVVSVLPMQEQACVVGTIHGRHLWRVS